MELISLQSYDALPRNLRECFLDMAFFLKDQKIIGSTINDLWYGLYGIESNLCMTYLQDLVFNNLIKLLPLRVFLDISPIFNYVLFKNIRRNECNDDGLILNELLVKQDNTFREFAMHKYEKEYSSILQSKRLNFEIQENKYPNWCLNPKQPFIINATLLSISTDESFLSKWVEMECPNVEALVLNISSSNYELPNFIVTMKKLKVVIIINHGLDPTNLTNLWCLSSLPNLKRIRFEKVSISFLDIPKLHLNSLEKLSLWLCYVVEASKESQVLGDIVTNTDLESLQEIEVDYCYNLVELPNWVSQVVSLKKLSITNCNKLCTILESIGNLKNLEMLRLSSCSNLCELPETVESLSDLRFLDISGCFRLKKLPIEIGKLHKLKKISMRDCYRCELPDSVKCLDNLEVKCDEGTMFMWERFKSKMKNLTITEEETEHNLNFLQLF